MGQNSKLQFAPTEPQIWHPVHSQGSNFVQYLWASNYVHCYPKWMKKFMFSPKLTFIYPRISKLSNVHWCLPNGLVTWRNEVGIIICVKCLCYYQKITANTRRDNFLIRINRDDMKFRSHSISPELLTNFVAVCSVRKFPIKEKTLFSR